MRNLLLSVNLKQKTKSDIPNHIHSNDENCVSLFVGGNGAADNGL